MSDTKKPNPNTNFGYQPNSEQRGYQPKKKITQFGKNANVTKTEEYVEVSVTYEVIENIGMQKKQWELNLNLIP